MSRKLSGPAVMTLCAAVNPVWADGLSTNPFVMQPLAQAYLVAEAATSGSEPVGRPAKKSEALTARGEKKKESGRKTNPEAKCGEAKCGGNGK